jgi:hypothetical protein
VATFEAAPKEASGPRRSPEAAFCMDLRPDFRWPHLQVTEIKEKTGDGVSKWTTEKTQFWAVATPL